MNDVSLVLPAQVNAQIMKRYFRPGDPVIVLIAKGIGSTDPYEFRDREGRSYTLNWDAKLDGHVLRLPWHLWMAEEGKLAQVIMHRRKVPFAMVVLVELSEAEAVEKGGCGVPKDDVLHYQRMLEVLEDGAMRSRALCWAMGVDEEALKQLLGTEACPAELSLTGWVKLKSFNL